MFAEHGVLNYRTYLVGAIFIVLVPGPNMISVLRNSTGRRVKGGYLAAGGMFIGDVVPMFLVHAGAAVLIKATSALFNIVHYLDAFYLLYLGVKILYVTLKSKASDAAPEEVPFGVIFKRASILSLTNPKAILSYVSFFMQLIDVNAPHSGLSFFTLAITLEVMSFFYPSLLILSDAFVMQYIRTRKKLAKVDNSLIGLILVGFATYLAMLQS